MRERAISAAASLSSQPNNPWDDDGDIPAEAQSTAGRGADGPSIHAAAVSPLPLSSTTSHPSASLIPSVEDAAKFASIVIPRHATDVIEGNLLPRDAGSATASRSPSHDAALGICAHWHSATQDVDFERKLLLRALLAALPHGACVLPDGCASIDDIDLAPIKVQALLEALGQRQRVDLNSNAFRWDVKQPPPKLAWGGDEFHNLGHDRAASGARGGRRRRPKPPPWAGLSKRQLDVASYEAFLLAMGGADGASGGVEGGDDGRCLALIGAQLGIGSRQHEKLHRAAHKVAAAAASGVGDAGRGSDGDDGASAAERADSAAAERCGIAHRIALLQATKPSDFATDNDFFEWQERQAALLGASFHAMLTELASRYDDAEQSPAFGMGALVDALFMELLATSRPTTHAAEPRSSDGFPAALYASCVERIGALYTTLRQLSDAEEGGEEDEEAVGRATVEATPSRRAAAAQRLRAERRRRQAGALPPPVRLHLYLVALASRFEVDERCVLLHEAAHICLLARTRLAPALCISRAEHHACLVASALSQADGDLAAALPRLLAAIAWPLQRLGASARREPFGSGALVRCARLLTPLAELLVARLLDLCGLSEPSEQPLVGASSASLCGSCCRRASSR